MTRPRRAAHRRLRAAAWTLAAVPFAVPFAVTAAPPAAAAPAPLRCLTVVAGVGWFGGVSPGPAVQSHLWSPAGVAVDTAGNVYATTTGDELVVRIDSTGTLGVVAGGLPGYGSITPGPARGSALWNPTGVAVARDGTVFIADSNAHLVEAVTPSGTLSVVAGVLQNGRGVAGPSTPGPATASNLDHPSAVAVDGAGNVYVADRGNRLVEKITSGGVLSIAVDLRPVNGEPAGIAVDAGGNLYVADAARHVVERTTPGGAVSTVAGIPGTPGVPAPGTATASPLDSPSGVAVDAAGNVYVSDTGNDLVVQVDPAGDLTVIAGAPTGSTATSPVPATSWRFQDPTGLAVDAAGTLHVADYANHRLERLDRCSVPAITSAATVSGVVGRPLSHTVTASGTPAPAWSVTGTLPPGLTFDPATGVLSGTPQGPATATVSVTATNLAGQDSRNLTVTIAPVPPVPMPVPPVPPVPAVPVPAVPVPAVPVPAVPTPTPTPGPAPVVVPDGVHRLTGTDPADVTRLTFPADRSAPAVVLAAADRSPDVVSGTVLAHALGGPLLLTGRDGPSPATAAELARVLAPGGTVVLVGGPDAVPEAVTRAVRRAAPTATVRRVAGSDRYATAARVATEVEATAPGTASAPVYLASAASSTDGLVAAARAGLTGGVVLLTDGTAVPAATRAHLLAQDPAGARTTPVGGPALAASGTVPAVAAAARGNALAGADRYATSRLAARGTPRAAVIELVSGERDPRDSAAAAVAASGTGRLRGPLLLTPADHLHPATRQALAELAAAADVRATLVFGGAGDVTDGVVREAERELGR